MSERSALRRESVDEWHPRRLYLHSVQGGISTLECGVPVIFRHDLGPLCEQNGSGRERDHLTPDGAWAQGGARVHTTRVAETPRLVRAPQESARVGKVRACGRAGGLSYLVTAAWLANERRCDISRASSPVGQRFQEPLFNCVHKFG